MFTGILGQIKKDCFSFDNQVWEDMECIARLDLTKETRAKTIMAATRILTFAALAASVLCGISAVISGSIVTGVLATIISSVVRDIFFIQVNLDNRLLNLTLTKSLQAAGNALAEVTVRPFNNTAEQINKYTSLVKDVGASIKNPCNKQLIIQEAHEKKVTTYCQLVHDNLLLKPIWDKAATYIVPFVIGKYYTL